MARVCMSGLGSQDSVSHSDESVASINLLSFVRLSPALVSYWPLLLASSALDWKSTSAKPTPPHSSTSQVSSNPQSTNSTYISDTRDEARIVHNTLMPNRTDKYREYTRFSFPKVNLPLHPAPPLVLHPSQIHALPNLTVASPYPISNPHPVALIRTPPFASPQRLCSQADAPGIHPPDQLIYLFYLSLSSLTELSPSTKTSQH
ncbi:hypothetical protein BKA64DRAFT_659686 [Cadophora sp. MPI-SDFR-AT-0126]|nr:hypothetical protein BKA64DRAFT_659686 [Leotiomycetes sp. MPI-SDFR-AT-0126]